MKHRAVTATIFGIAVLALASVACNGEDSTPGPTAPTATTTAPAATPTAPTEAASSVTGTVTYREKIALTPDAVVEVTLVDVSRADAPSVTVGEQVIENPGQVPINFEITYDPADIDDRFTYAVQVRITEGDRLVFITDTRYPVITRGAPTHVDIVLVKVAAAPAPAAPTPTPVTPVSTTPPATATPTPTPAAPDTVEVDAPIESVKVVVAETDPQQFTLQIVSGLPNGCASFKGYTSSVEGSNVVVTVTNLMPAGPVACTTDYRRHQGEIALGDGFTVGQTYRVIVNGNVTNGFTPTDPAGPELGVTISPIEQVEVTSDGAGYTLTVVSLLPTGSSCSFFDGYEVRTPMLGLFEVTVTHQQVVTFAPCTADLPIVVTEIPLGTDLAAGRDYTVTVNGQLSTTFTVR